MLLLILLGFSADNSVAQQADSTGKPFDFSDLARISDNYFLAVSDRKNSIEPGYRVMLLTLTQEHGLAVKPIVVKDWKDKDGPPSDLEACCRIPGRDNEFLLAESSYYQSKFGRVFHVTLLDTDRDTPELVVNGVMRIYDRQLNENECSYSGDNVAGMVCFEAGGNLIVAYGERGGDSANGLKPGTLVWGELELDGYRFEKWGESPLVAKSILGSRDCAALHLMENADHGYDLVSVATNDPGDNGPFHSVIFRAGKFVPDKSGSTLKFERDREPKILANIDGHKVEGLASAVCSATADFSISTDDESLGGVWRAIVIDRQ